MLTTKTTVKSKLETVLPTYYEDFNQPKTLPCITYMETNNAEDIYIDDFRSSTVSYQVRYWGKIDSMATNETYICEIDEAMRELGFHRVTASDTVISNIFNKVLLYEGRILEY